MVQFILILFTFIIFSNDEPTLLVRVQNIKQPEGKLMIAAYKDERSFLEEPVFRSAVVPVERTGSQWVALQIPYGSYAIAIYQDENEDLRLNTIFGIPIEPFGFSRDAMGKLGPPSFEQAVIQFDQKDQTISISLH